MKQLIQYVDESNIMRKLMKQELFDLDSGLSRKMIAGRLESDLSPENLCCDGEAPAAYVRKRFKLLTKAAEQLTALDPTATVEV